MQDLFTQFNISDINFAFFAGVWFLQQNLIFLHLYIFLYFYPKLYVRWMGR